VYLAFEDLVVTIPNKGGDKVLIDHVTGYAASGRVLALMGPSGTSTRGTQHQQPLHPLSLSLLPALRNFGGSLHAGLMQCLRAGC
jgi:hypothetical protein